MNGKGIVPSAWDDEWEKAADKPESARVEPAPKLSKAARKAQHIEQNKQLWDSADNPARHHWLEAQGIVPLKHDYQAPVTLLSRKPPSIAKKEGAGGLGKLSLEDDDDSEDERRKKREAEFEERQRKAKSEREEKQKRYAEARERIMGASNKPALASSSRENSQARENNRRPRGKLSNGNSNRRSQPQSSAEQSPARLGTSEQQLFDPEDMTRRPKRDQGSTTPLEDQPLRQPRGPDHSGRGGFGFGSRGRMLAS